ncbi:unnamed protein product [Rangifer tarandus platyrhynchus]|uniref:Uncharacterized protein n=1 Tax=Rangifer tarandus platyrhynchus TaxID=3082113 RepID=A0ABN8XKJ2_RANTA|nr:unnamed protein product [Rangifer tarandus platyrhynchus]
MHSAVGRVHTSVHVYAFGAEWRPRLLHVYFRKLRISLSTTSRRRNTSTEATSSIGDPLTSLALSQDVLLLFVYLARY